MQKVVDIVFVKAVWKMGQKKPDPFEDNWVHSEKMRVLGLDTAHTELETKIKELLKQGWVLKGDVAHRRFSKKSEGGFLVQTMVKYETPSVETNLIEM